MNASSAYYQTLNMSEGQAALIELVPSKRELLVGHFW